MIRHSNFEFPVVQSRILAYADRHFGPADVARVVVVCTLETRDFDHITEIRMTLQEKGIEAKVE